MTLAGIFDNEASNTQMKKEPSHAPQTITPR